MVDVVDMDGMDGMDDMDDMDSRDDRDSSCRSGPRTTALACHEPYLAPAPPE